MATHPQADLCRDGRFCSPCLNDCDSSQSIAAPSMHGRSHQLDQSEMKETQEFLASELNKLSVEERSNALNDLHCVGDEVEETPELIEQSLTEFDQVVQTTPEPIYNVAVNQNRSYVEDPYFRLKFLWANRFNVRNSVNHMMNFLRQKALYFGEEKVAQDIVPEDMNTEEIALMRSGIFQIFKDRDQSGRVIFYNSPFRIFKHMMRIADGERNIKTLVHVLYHIVFNVLITMPDVQTKGIVMLVYEDESKRDESPYPGFSIQRKIDSFFKSLPLRISSLHLCLYSSPESLTLVNKIFQVGLKTLSAHSVTRTRLHYGSDMERQYELRTFGIPLNSFPVDQNGHIRADLWMSWCNEYLENVTSAIGEQAIQEDGTTLIATDEDASNEYGTSHHTATNGILDTDVLLGSGRYVQYHAGNVRFREFLEEHAEAYDSMPRNQRLVARIRYTQELLSSGTRFLRQTPDAQSWGECNFDQAMEKVAQFYRSRRRNKNRRHRRKNDP